MTLSEKVAYLKGVAEGLKFDPEKSAEGKLISIMMDILEHMALNAEENDCLLYTSTGPRCWWSRASPGAMWSIRPPLWGRTFS